MDPQLQFYNNLSNLHQALVNIASFYDKLDCINAISYSHEFLNTDICLNLLYLLIYMKAEKV